MSGGAGGAATEGGDTGAARPGGAGSGGARGVRAETTPVEDTAVLTQWPCLAPPSGFQSVPHADRQTSQVNEALYFKVGDDGVTCWVLIYVDDLLAASSSTAMMRELKELLEAAFELRKISPIEKYLGLEIVRDRPARKLWLHQQSYVDKLRMRFINEEQTGQIPKTPASVNAYGKLTFDDEDAQSDSKDGLSLFDLTSGASSAPTTDADSTSRSQWLTRDTAACLAVRNHLPSTERAHFSQYKSARALYDAVAARYSSPTTAALSRLMLPYLFPDLAAFSTVADLVAHLRSSDARYRAALPTMILPTNSPPMYITLYYLVTRLPDSLSSVRDHFLSLCPTELTIDLLEERLAAAEKSILAVGASRGDRRSPFFKGCSLIPLLPSVASAATVNLIGTEEVGAASAALSGRRRTGKGKGIRGGGGGGGGSGVEAVVGVVLGVGASVAAVEAVAAVAEEVAAAVAVVEVAEEVVLVAVRPRSVEALVATSVSSSCAPVRPRLFSSFVSGMLGVGGLGVPVPARTFFALALVVGRYALGDITEGDCYLCVLPDLGTVAAALDASASAAQGASVAAALGASAFAAPGAGTSPPSGTAPTESFHTFTLDSGASCSFFRDSTTLTPLSRPVAVSLADPSEGPVLAHSSTVQPCPAALSGLLSGLHLPSFSTNLVSGADLQDVWADQFTPGGQRVTHSTCSRTDSHLATFTCRPGSSLYTQTTAPPPVSASGPVAASSQVFAAASRSSPASAPCSCRPLTHETLLWHHRLGHPSLPRLRGMASRALVSGLPRSLPALPPGPAPTRVPCVEDRQRAAPHSSSFPPTEAPLQTLHMDVWGPARIRGQSHERYFLLVVDDYSRYTTVFPLRSKSEVREVLIDWIRGAHRQLSESFGSDLPVLRLHSDGGGEFSSDPLRAFCLSECIRQTFTLPASPQQNGIPVHRISMFMDVARTPMIHAATPRFLWPFASQYAAHQINLQPRFSLPETTPTLRWTGKVGDASAFRVWGSRAFVRDTTADKLSSRAVPCVFLGFPPDAPGWQFYHPTSRRVLSSKDVTFDETVSYYRHFPHRTASPPPPAALPRPRSSPGRPPPPPGSCPLRGVAPEGTVSGGAEPARAASGGALGVQSRREPLSPQRLREWYSPRCRVPAGAGAAVGAAAGAGGAVGATGGAGAAGGGAGAAVGAAGAGGAAGTGDPRAEGTGSVSAVVGGAARPRPYFVPLLQQPASPLPCPSPYSGPTRGLTERREPESRPVSPESRPASPVRTVRAGRVSRPRLPPVPHNHSMTLRTSTAPQRVPLPSPPASSLPDGPDPASDSLRAASPTVTRFLATAVTDPLFESSAASALVAELVDFAAACRLDYAASLVAEPASASICPPSVGGECALGTDVLEDREEDLECFAVASPHLAAMNAKMASWKATRTYIDEIPPPGANIVSGMWIFRVKRPPGSSPSFKARYVARGFSQRQGVDFIETFSPTPKMTTLRVLLHVAAQRDYELHSLDFSTAFIQGSLHEEIWLRRLPGFTGSFPAGTQWSLRRPVYDLRLAPREWHDTLRMTLAALGFAPSTAEPSLFLRTDATLPPFYVLVYVDDLVFATCDTEALAHVKSELQKRHTCTDLGELTSYLGLRITQDRAQRTITLTQSHMVQQVLQRFGFTYSSPQSTPLPTDHSLSAPPSDESVEPSGPYPELVSCLMYLMTCTRPDLAYPLSLLARYVAPGRHRKVHWDAAKRVLRYLCSTSGMGLVLGGRARVVLTGHADASWVDDLATQRSSQGYTFSLGSGSVSWRSTRSSSVLSSSCEAEIYAGAMAAQELRWLTYLLTDLGEAPGSPPVLYVDNKAMLTLCRSTDWSTERSTLLCATSLLKRCSSVASFVLLTWPLRPTLLMF
ncbi:unnamed protein product [Closterium sp. NIES-54]